jgi:hypothetical protein
LSYGRFELEAYHNKHLRYNIQAAINSGDTLRTDTSAFMRKAKMFQLKVGYSLRKNDFIEKLNLIPSVGLFAHQASLGENVVRPNLFDHTYSFQKTGRLKDRSFGAVVNLKVQYQIRSKVLPALALMHIGAEGDYYLLASNKNHRTITTGTINLDSGTKLKNSGYAYALYIKLCAPVTIYRSEKKEREKLFDFQHL